MEADDDIIIIKETTMSRHLIKNNAPNNSYYLRNRVMPYVNASLFRKVASTHHEPGAKQTNLYLHYIKVAHGSSCLHYSLSDSFFGIT